MKNLFKTAILLVIFTFSSCSKDDDNNNPNTQNKSSINPPSWIIGDWNQEFLEEVSDVKNGFRFTKNDFCVIVSSTSMICQRGIIQSMKDGKGYVNVEEEKNNTEYKITITMGSSAPGHSITTYHFEKVAPNKMIWKNHHTKAVYVKE